MVVFKPMILTFNQIEGYAPIYGSIEGDEESIESGWHVNEEVLLSHTDETLVGIDCSILDVVVFIPLSDKHSRDYHKCHEEQRDRECNQVLPDCLVADVVLLWSVSISINLLH